MKVKGNMKNKLDILGFKDMSDENEDAICSYYEKHFGQFIKIRVGDPYIHYDTSIKFIEETYTTSKEIESYIPQWAFMTVMKLYSMGFLDEEEE